MHASRRRKGLIVLIGLILLLGSLSPWLLLRAVAALPGTYRQRLPHQLVRLVTTPLPTALPAPVAAAGRATIIIPTISLPTATAEPTTATATAIPKPAGGDKETIEAAAANAAPVPSPTATARPTATPTATTPPTLPAALINGLEIIPQKFNNCGPTNLSINLGFYGHIDPQLDIAANLKPNPDDRNVGPEELVGYVNAHTPLRATLHSGGDLKLLKQFIAAGFPVVIEKGLIPSEWEGWMGHYLTLFAYDDAVEEFYSMDTFLGPWDGSGRVDSYETIEREWGQFNDTFFVVYPEEEELTVKSILGPTLLNPIPMWHQAAQNAQTEIELRPDDAFSWFNLGTSLTRLGQLTGQVEFFQSAAAAYDRAREAGLPARMLWYQFDPYVAYLKTGRVEDVLALAEATLASEGGRNVEETYLYQGHALSALGDKARATAAYERALQLNPNLDQARQALDALKQ